MPVFHSIHNLCPFRDKHYQLLRFLWNFLLFTFIHGVWNVLPAQFSNLPNFSYDFTVFLIGFWRHCAFLQLSNIDWNQRIRMAANPNSNGGGQYYRRPSYAQNPGPASAVPGNLPPASELLSPSPTLSYPNKVRHPLHSVASPSIKGSFDLFLNRTLFAKAQK
jgi:hypothetical protein